MLPGTFKFVCLHFRGAFKGFLETVIFRKVPGNYSLQGRFLWLSLWTVKFGALFPPDWSSKCCRIFFNLQSYFSAILCSSLLERSRHLSGLVIANAWGPKTPEHLSCKPIFPFSSGEEKRKNIMTCWYKSNLSSFHHCFYRDIVLLLRKRGMVQNCHPPSAASNIRWDLGSVCSSGWAANISPMHYAEVLRAMVPA